MRGRLIGWVIGLVIGIPTSIYGVQWMEFKFLKQQIDCITDTNDAVMNEFSKVEQGIHAQDFDSINGELKVCIKNIDARKGTITFAEGQYKKYH